MNKTPGSIIADLRKEKGLTQLQLAQFMGGYRQGCFKMGEKFILPGYKFIA